MSSPQGRQTVADTMSVYSIRLLNSRDLVWRSHTLSQKEESQSIRKCKDYGGFAKNWKSAR